MRWAFRIARVFGIDLKVHATFLIIVVIGAMEGAAIGAHPAIHAPVAGAGLGVLTILLLFACVTLHELGHSVIALRFGLPVREIVLLPIGGIAFMGRNPQKPRDELLIALAGPAVNVVIIAVLLPLLLISFGWPGLRTLSDIGRIVLGMHAHPVAMMTASNT